MELAEHNREKIIKSIYQDVWWRMFAVLRNDLPIAVPFTRKFPEPTVFTSIGKSVAVKIYSYDFKRNKV